MANRPENMKKRYLKLYPERDTGLNVIQEISKRLGVCLSSDFIEISRYFDGYYPLGNISLFSFDYEGNYSNITDETIRLRKSVKLPNKYVVLYESEVSFIVFETNSDATLKARVIDCSLEDAYNLAGGKELENNPIVYKSFSDFFEYLISEEEEKRCSK